MQPFRLAPVEIAGADGLPPYLDSFVHVARVGGDVIPAIATITQRFGFNTFTYWAVTRTTPLVEGRLYELSTIQPEWSHRYDEMAYAEIDPRLGAALAQTTPIVWDRRTWEGRNAAVDAFLADAAIHGVGSGVCVAINDPSFGLARLEFDSISPTCDPARRGEIRKAFGDLMVVARFLHELLVVAIRRNELKSRAINGPLSTRERECLSRAARGATSAAIAQDLGINVRAVDLHFASIRAKFGCLNNDEAIGYAIKRGLIGR